MSEISSDGPPIAPAPLPDRTITQEAFGNLGSEIPNDPHQIAQLLIDARSLEIDGLDDKMSQLRILRKPGDDNHWNDETAGKLDKVVISLFQQQEDELASRLLSCSMTELERLSWKIDNVAESNEANPAIKTRLEKILEEKQLVLRSQLAQNGVSETIAKQIIHQVGFPEVALQISPDFWKLFQTLPSEVQNLIYSPSRDVSVTATQIEAIHAADLDSYAERLVGQLIKIGRTEGSERYLSSLKLLLDALNNQALFEGNQTERNNVFVSFFDFADPNLAYQSSLEIFGLPEGLVDISVYGYKLKNIVHGSYYDSSHPHIKIYPDIISGWKSLMPLIVTLPEIDHWTSICAKAMQMTKPQEFVQKFQESLPLLQKYDSEYDFLRWAYGDLDNPLQYLTTFDRIQPLLTGNTERDVPKYFMEWLNFGDIPEDRIQMVLGAGERLHNHGLSMIEVGLEEFKSFVEIEEMANSPQLEQLELRFCEDWKIGKEASDRYSDYVKQLPEGTWRSFAQTPRPDLQQFPNVINRFQELGIDPDIAQRMFRSWSTFSAASKTIYENEDIPPRSLTHFEKQTAIKEQTERVTKEIIALSNYADAYGKEELAELIHTFGIYNLTLYEIPNLHKQLIQWKSGETPIKNIVINSLTDWNGSSENLGKESSRTLGDEDAVFFEADSELQLAKILIAVGNHEREFGRDPKKTNAIQNVLIHAHASPQGLALGPDGQSLDLSDYVDAEKKNVKNNGRVNDYRRHLGNNFRVLLQACSTAGETIDGINIANTMAEYHNTVVEGSPFITKGMLIINPDGSVTFPTTEGKVPSVTYSGK